MKTLDIKTIRKTNIDVEAQTEHHGSSRTCMLVSHAIVRPELIKVPVARGIDYATHPFELDISAWFPREYNVNPCGIESLGSLDLGLRVRFAWDAVGKTSIAFYHRSGGFRPVNRIITDYIEKATGVREVVTGDYLVAMLDKHGKLMDFTLEDVELGLVVIAMDMFKRSTKGLLYEF